MQAMELEDQLQSALEMFDVEVLKGKTLSPIAILPFKISSESLSSTVC